MLLIDGVRYELWTPPSEDEFERMVIEHSREIFGEQSIYLDLKQKLKSVAGIGSIPDGFVLTLGQKPQWYVVEYELSGHPLYDHIVPQLTKFINGLKNRITRDEIGSTLYAVISSDEYLKLKIKEHNNPSDIHKFLWDLVSQSPVLSIIIEKDTKELSEVVEALPHSSKRVIEFQTFTREDAEKVHAHLFEPLFLTHQEPETPTEVEDISQRGGERITVKDLIDSHLLRAGQLIWSISLKGKKHSGKVLRDGSIKLDNVDEALSLNSATLRITGYPWNAWYFWKTTRENGTECLLGDLREEYKNKQSS